MTIFDKEYKENLLKLIVISQVWKMGIILIKAKQETKVEAGMIEFVIRYSGNKVWISIESMVANKAIENAFKAELRKKK